jgi:hypothetical protein
MWNPAFDTVFCDGLAQDLGKSFFYGGGFPMQFPLETREVRFLALLSSHWTTGMYSGPTSLPTGSTLPKRTSAQFSSLLEVCVVFDEPYESECVRIIGSLQKRSPDFPTLGTGWTVPMDIEAELLSENAKHLKKEWAVPSVRFVGSKDKILGGSNENLTLRCSPCPDMIKVVG